ncbi:unnamed protein product [marine sediment metagenome]|uniref:Uncharacterized protein n=1 Tax=marine sediment metagenome TaxID=412755 RepID=X0WMX1_9ZZZZ
MAMSKGKDFREGWTTKPGRAGTPWHYFRESMRQSVCGSWTREGDGILAGIHGVGKGRHCKLCLKIYEKKRPDEAPRVEGDKAFDREKILLMQAMQTIPEEEVRRIEISILDEEGGAIFEACGNVSRKTAHKFLEGVGYAFIPQEPLRLPRPVYPVAMGKISCEQTRDCTDYPMECSKCEGNKAKSYFKPKEE